MGSQEGIMKPVKRVKWIGIMLLPLGAGVARISSLYPAQVEQIYSNEIYRIWGQLLSTATGRLPFSLMEMVLAILGLLLFYLFIQGVLRRVQKKPRRKGAALQKKLVPLLTLVGVLYLLFLFCWGLNYYRQPFAVTAGFDQKTAASEELISLCSDLADQAGNFRSLIEEDQQGVMHIANDQEILLRAGDGYERARRFYPVLGGHYGTAKTAAGSAILSYAGISGIYFPFTGEAQVNRKMPDALLPVSVCHEMAHQRGFAREEEANYLAYYTCSLNPDLRFQYSGTLVALIYAMSALYGEDRLKYNEISAQYDPGVVRDLNAISTYWQQHQGVLSQVSSYINDFYLKANQQSAGIHSYGEMVNLLIQARRLQ